VGRIRPFVVARALHKREIPSADRSPRRAVDGALVCLFALENRGSVRIDGAKLLRQGAGQTGRWTVRAAASSLIMPHINTAHLGSSDQRFHSLVAHALVRAAFTLSRNLADRRSV